MPQKKRYPKPERKSAKQIFAEVHEIAQQERELSANRQRKAGIKEPVKTGFKRADQLPAEINAALDVLSKLRYSGDVEADQIMRRLYSHISRGFACLTPDDVLALAKLEPAEIRAVSFWLVKGLPLNQALWNARGKEKPM